MALSSTVEASTSGTGGSGAVPATAAVPTRCGPANGPFPAWREIFPLQRALMPLGSEPQFATEKTTILRGLFIDLADPAGTGETLAQILDRRDLRTGPVEIHADILRISTEVVVAVESLLINARVLEVGAAASLTLPQGPGLVDTGAKIDIHAGQIVLASKDAPLKVGCFGHTQAYGPDDAPNHLWLAFQREAGLAGGRDVYRFVGGSAMDLGPNDALQAQMQLGAAKRLCRSRQTKDVNPFSVAVAMARWVNRLHSQPNGDVSLLAESAGLLARLTRYHRGLYPVPRLRLEQYSQIAKDTVDALEQVERQSQHFFGRQENARAARKGLEDLRLHYENESSLSGKILADSTVERASARKAYRDAVTKLDEEQKAIPGLRDKFKDGVAVKRAQEEAKMGLAIGVAIIGVFATVLSFCGGGGNPAAAAEGVDQAAKVAEKIEKVEKLIDKIARWASKILALLGFLEKGYKVWEIGSKAWSADQALRKGGPLSPPGSEDDAGPTSTDWDEFEIDVDIHFKPVLELGVTGAEEFVSALLKLAVRGRAVIECGANLARCEAATLQHECEHRRDEEDLSRVKARIAEPNSGAFDFALRLACERMVDHMKLSVVQYLDQLGDAYRYWALREPQWIPSIDMTPAELRVMLVSLEAASVQTKESFPKDPSSWRPEPWSFAANKPRLAEQALAAFRSKGVLSWRVRPKELVGHDRIRISEIRVWLLGLESEGQDISIDIKTSGIYSDRLAGQVYRFAAVPLDRTFSYVIRAVGRDSDPAGHRVDITDFADDTESAYLQPTPFTTWTITVTSEGGQAVDLRKVSDVAVEFIGTNIRMRTAAPSQMPAGATAAGASSGAPADRLAFGLL